jgi:2,3-bisphosphoglycerate-dependent phosphoglycerate mutase
MKPAQHAPHAPLAAQSQRLHFVRHGATDLNLAGLRCGGDIDVPLSEVGRQQAAAAARCIANLQPPVGLIVTSQLQRTQHTAQIIASVLHSFNTSAGERGAKPLRIVVEPLFAERFLGEWNGQTKAATQALLDAGHTPPGGESKAQFKRRVSAALRTLYGLWPQRPLLVSSQGVARVLGELAGKPDRVKLANAQLAAFDLSAPALQLACESLHCENDIEETL